MGNTQKYYVLLNKYWIAQSAGEAVEYTNCISAAG